ncbi:hypothetical protein [Micromonospora sp. MA102]|uniref:hypothetical protein n=1 Tax=Micromonospora sp. MA102 TaxID=2952755 RepID=UPI0021C61D8B|nr:hypothetical protein [Micromonospora sp. MA102]
MNSPAPIDIGAELWPRRLRVQDPGTGWLLKLSAGEELGLSRVLAGPRHDQLRQQ